MSEGRHRAHAEYGITVGELGASAAQTLVVALLPVLVAPYARSALWIGFVVGGEGLFALLVRLWIGQASDRLPPRLVSLFGRRGLFLLVTTPLMASALVLMPFLSGYWQLATTAFVFFAGLHGYLTPLWALMVDSVPDERRGRVQGTRGVLRALGLGYGLVVSGVLYGLWRPLPFIVAAAILVVSTALTAAAARVARSDYTQIGANPKGGTRQLLGELRHNPAALWLLGANALWNGAIDGIRPYAFLFTGAVLGLGITETSFGLLVLVAGLAIGSLFIGFLGDRYGRGVLLRLGVGATFIAMGLAFFARDVVSALAVALIAGIGAATIIALPYPIFASMVGEEHTGQYTGLFVLSVSFGRVLSPMLVGAAIDLGRPLLPALRGYPFMWVAAAVLAGAGWLAAYKATSRPRQRKDSDSASNCG